MLNKEILAKRFKTSDLKEALNRTRKGSEREAIYTAIAKLERELDDVGSL